MYSRTPSATLEDVIRIGTKSEFARQRLERNAAASGRWADSEIPCLNPYEDQLRIAFREGIERVMDSLQLDAIVYPSWTYPPALVDSFQVQIPGRQQSDHCSPYWSACLYGPDGLYRDRTSRRASVPGAHVRRAHPH